jgi:hypothetical protein
MIQAFIFCRHTIDICGRKCSGFGFAAFIMKWILIHFITVDIMNLFYELIS